MWKLLSSVFGGESQVDKTTKVSFIPGFHRCSPAYLEGIFDVTLSKTNQSVTFFGGSWTYSRGGGYQVLPETEHWQLHEYQEYGFVNELNGLILGQLHSTRLYSLVPAQERHPFIEQMIRKGASGEVILNFDSYESSTFDLPRSLVLGKVGLEGKLEVGGSWILEIDDFYRRRVMQEVWRLVMQRPQWLALAD